MFKLCKCLYDPYAAAMNSDPRFESMSCVRFWCILSDTAREVFDALCSSDQFQGPTGLIDLRAQVVELVESLAFKHRNSSDINCVRDHVMPMQNRTELSQFAAIALCHVDAPL